MPIANEDACLRVVVNAGVVQIMVSTYNELDALNMVHPFYVMGFVIAAGIFVIRAGIARFRAVTACGGRLTGRMGAPAQRTSDLGY